MLRRFHRISNAARKYGQRKEALQSVGQRNQSSIRPRATELGHAHSFGKHLAHRQQEAQRTILFQVPSVNAYDDLQKHCSQFGSVNDAYFYQGRRRKENLILIEFSEKDAADEVMKAQFLTLDDSERSRYPVFDVKRFKASPSLNQSAKIVDLDVETGKDRLRTAEVFSLLLRADSVDDQINTLFQLMSLNDLHQRLRFLAVVQIEDAIRTVSPHARTYPFGSSVSGFGRQLSDLDFVVKNHDLTVPSMTGMMEFLPGITDMTPLSHATVPIIKYHQSLLNLDADLSLDNLRYVYATEILYCCGQLDSRLRPLIFSLRLWADQMHITSQLSGPRIKNYGMNLLTIFFLQQLEKPILPPLMEIANLERENVQHSGAKFIKDLSQLNFRTTNTDSVADLFVGFMKFYKNFDFAQYAISVERGSTSEKTDSSRIEIINLLGTDNVAGNVPRKYANRVCKAFVTANSLDFDLANETKHPNEPWGLVQYYKKCVNASSQK